MKTIASSNQSSGKSANSYAPFPTNPFLFRPRSSHRRQVFSLLSWYDEISSGTLLVIIILATLRIIPHYHWFIIWPISYTVLAGLRLALHHVGPVRRTLLGSARLRWQPARVSAALARVLGDTSSSISARQRDEESQRDKTQKKATDTLTLYRIVMIFYALVAAGFVISVRRASAQIGIPIGEDSAVWLLFAPVIWLMARRDSLFWVLIVCALALVANVFSFIYADATMGLLLTGNDLRLITVETAWLIPFCLLPTLLMRHLTDRQADLKDTEEAVREIADLHLRVSFENGYANEAVAIIQRMLANQIPHDKVNDKTSVEVSILLATAKDAPQGRRLRMIGSTSEGGQRLAQSGFTLQWHEGITGWAASTGQYKLVNNLAAGDPHFYPKEDAFPHTKAELAIPLKRGEEVIGVLDLESSKLNAFDEDIVTFLGFITPYLAIALDNAQSLTRVRGLAEISSRVVSHVLTQGDSRVILKDIAEVARGILHADSVVAYPCDVVTGVFGTPILSLPAELAPGADDRMMSQRKLANLAKQVLRSSDLLAALQEGKPVLLPTLHAASPRQGPVKSGPYRRQAQSDQPQSDFQLVIPLVAGATDANVRAEEHENAALYGFLLVRYHSSFLLDDALLGWCRALAQIAALALQTTYYTKKVVDDRQYMWQEVHDGLSQYAAFTRMLLEQVAEAYSTTYTISPADGEKLLLARTISQAMQGQVNYLIEAWRVPMRSTGLFDELRAYAEFVRQTLEISCECRCQGDEGLIVPEVQYQIRLIVREAVHNATRHGRASEITIAVRAEERRVYCRITDNGIGFHDKSIVPRGLASLRQRAEKLGGSMEVTSDKAQGTTINLKLPTQPAHLVRPLAPQPHHSIDEMALASLREAERQEQHGIAAG